MGHNSVVSGYPKFTGISRVDRLSMGPPGFGVSQCMTPRFFSFNLSFSIIVIS